MAPKASKVARGTKRRKHRRKGKRRGKKSHIVNRKGGNTMVVYHPKHINDFMPEEFITTHTNVMRFKCASGLASGLSGLAQHFNIQLGQLFRPYLANNHTNFVQYSGATPAISLLGDYANTRSYVGYPTLALIYDSYTPLSASIEICIDNLDSSSDSVQIMVLPYCSTINFDSFGLANITDEQILTANKYGKRQAWNTYVNEGISKLRNHINFAEFLGYSSIKELMSDRANFQYSTNNTNQRPGTDCWWQVALASNNSTATANSIEFTIKLHCRVAYHGIMNALAASN